MTPNNPSKPEQMSPEEREAMERAFTERFANRRERFGAKPWYVAGWLAARDYYSPPELLDLLIRVERAVDPRSMLNVEVEEVIRNMGGRPDA